jgi:hypothetical protein
MSCINANVTTASAKQPKPENSASVIRFAEAEYCVSESCLGKEEKES